MKTHPFILFLAAAVSGVLPLLAQAAPATPDGTTRNIHKITLAPGEGMWAAVFDKSSEVQARFEGSKPPHLQDFFTPTETWEKYAGILGLDLSTTPQWDELVAAWQGIKPMEKLILGLRPSTEAYASSDSDPDLFINSFTDAAGRRFVVVVNGRIGQWDGNNPVWLDAPNTKLSVGADGNLTGYTPLRDPRECSITLSGDWKVTDARGMLRR